MYFADRQEAGRRLGAELIRFKGRQPVVLALPRGGVPVGFEVATRLGAPLDVVLVRKIGHPAQPELAIGAIADVEGLEKVIDEAAIADFAIPKAYLDREIARQRGEIEKRRQLYFKGRTPAEIRDRTAIVIDDGIATGATMRAALRAVRRRVPKRLVLAVPVAPADTLEDLRSEADETVCLFSPKEFAAVGLFYADFRPVEDDDVVDLLDRAAAVAARAIGTASPSRDIPGR